MAKKAFLFILFFSSMTKVNFSLANVTLIAENVSHLLCIHTFSLNLYFFLIWLYHWLKIDYLYLYLYLHQKKKDICDTFLYTFLNINSLVKIISVSPSHRVSFLLCDSKSTCQQNKVLFFSSFIVIFF